MCRTDQDRVTHRYQISDSPPGGINTKARQLVAGGASPFDRLEAYRGDMLCLSGVLWRLAGRSVFENAKGGPVFKRREPNDYFRIIP